MAVLTAFAMAAIVLIVGGTGCAGGSNVEAGLPEWADEAALAEQAQGLTDSYIARDFAAVARECSALGLSEQEFKDAGVDALDQLGEFKEYGDTAYMQGKDQSGKVYATAVQIANFANGTAQFTVSFYEDGSVCGFYFKLV